MRVSDKIELRILEERDLIFLPDLFKAVFRIDREEAYWRWKYFENPAGEQVMAVAVERKTGRVIGQTGVIPVNMLLEGRRVPCAQTCDVVVLPEYQKGGTFFKLHELTTREYLRRGIQLCYGFTITKVLKISVRLLKFKDVLPVERLAKVIDPGYFIFQKIKLSRPAAILGKIAGSMLRFIYRTPIRVPSHYRLKEVSSFDSRYDELMQALADKQKIMIDKCADYLNWRYIKCPGFNYKIFSIENDAEVIGYTVVSIEDEEIRRAYILELVARPDKQEVLEALLNRVIRYCYEVKATIVNAWSPERSAGKLLLRRKGFLPKETHHNLIVRPHFKPEELATDVTRPHLWEFSMGDSDYH